MLTQCKPKHWHQTITIITQFLTGTYKKKFKTIDRAEI